MRSLLKVPKDLYLKAFLTTSELNTKQVKAFEYAFRMREFESKYYWQRAAYFWAFNAAAFAGYFALNSTDTLVSSTILLIVTCLGIVFSVAWWRVNRGSKFWLEHWDRHIELLEDGIIGPLHKILICRSVPMFSNLIGPFPFSVTKTNEILTVFVATIWACLFGHAISQVKISRSPDMFLFAGILLSTFIFVYVLIFKGHIKRSKNAIEVQWSPTVDKIFEGKSDSI